MQGILPDEAQSLLKAAKISNLEVVVSDEVERVLLKLWQQEKPTDTDKALEITPAELAALWTITHRRPVRPDTARQMFRPSRKSSIKPSREWGAGPGLRRLYRLGDALNVHIRDTGRTKSPESQQ